MDNKLSRTIATGKNFLSKKSIKLLPLMLIAPLLSGCTAEQVNTGTVIGLIFFICALGTVKLSNY